MPKKYIRVTDKPTMGWAFRQLPFWERVELQVDRSGECHLFTGAKDDCGYGRIADSRNGPSRNKLIRVHRAVWEKDHGIVPDGLEVCHTCDTPICINPAHLFLGTHFENIKDMHKKRRQRGARGVANGHAKLIDEQVITIKHLLVLGETCAAIAKTYGVTEGMIRHIKKGRAWTHVK